MRFSAAWHLVKARSAAGLDCCTEQPHFVFKLKKNIFFYLYKRLFIWNKEKVFVFHLARASWEPARGPKPTPPLGEFFLTRAGEMEVVLCGTWKKHKWSQFMRHKLLKINFSHDIKSQHPGCDLTTSVRFRLKVSWALSFILPENVLVPIKFRKETNFFNHM